MRVIHVTPYFAPAYVYGGPPRTILGLCRGLQAAGVDVEVLTTTANGTTDLPPSPAEGDVVDGVPVRFLPRWSRLFFAAPIGRPLAAALDRADLCHVHGLWNVPEWIATREARARRLPYVLSPRGMLLDGALAHHRVRKRVLLPTLEAAAIRSAARVHATSITEAAGLVRFTDPSRIVVAPNGVDVDSARVEREPIRATAGIADGDPIVLFVGRVHPIKRLDLLAAAVAALRRDNPRVHLVIAGPDESTTLARLASPLAALGNGLRVVGQVDDEQKWRWMHDASVLACCSDSENFGMATAEAMAAGLPVVVTRTCPWADVERAGAGLWVDQRAETIAQGLRIVLADPGRAREMGARGRQLIEQSYSWPAVGRTVARCYDEILRERRAEAVA